MLMTTPTYPVRVDATLDERLNRWLWLVKWILAIPHFMVLVFLWWRRRSARGAWFAILFTGDTQAHLRLQRRASSAGLGGSRYYSFAVLGTDKYPPFSLGPRRPTGPARHRLPREALPGSRSGEVLAARHPAPASWSASSSAAEDGTVYGGVAPPGPPRPAAVCSWWWPWWRLLFTGRYPR